MKIILIAYEVESFAMCRLAKLLEEDGHETWVVNGDYYSFIDNTSIREYYHKHNLDRWFNFEQEYRKLYTTEYKVDWDYLKSFEKRFCKTKNLHQLIMTDPILSRSLQPMSLYVYSNVTGPKSRNQFYYWTELLLRWSESIFEKIKPDIIFTIERNYFIKNVFRQISHAKNIPILTLIYSRIGDTFTIVDNFGIGTSPDIKSYLSSTELDTEGLEQAEEYIRKFRSTMVSTIPGTPTSQLLKSDWLSPGGVVRKFLSAAREVIVHGIKKKKRYRGFWRSNYFNSRTLASVLFYFRVAVNKLRFRWFKPCDMRLPDKPFIYMPLHFIPEGSILTLTREYYEQDMIRFMAKELPSDLCLVVKEYAVMVGYRPFSFYKYLHNIPNVYLLDPRFPSKEAIEKSAGVTGVSGTALLEAAMLQKPTHCFGEPEFLDIVDFKGYEGFVRFAEHCSKGLNSFNYGKTLKYVQYMLEKSMGLNIKDVLYRRKSEGFESGVETIYQMMKKKWLTTTTK